MTNNTVYIFIVITLAFVSCKKEKLEGDSSILIGNWEWTYSEETINTCNPPTFMNVLTPDTENSEYSIEFMEKGKVLLFKKNEMLVKENIKSFHFGDYVYADSIYFYSFTIYLENNSFEKLSGKIGPDSIQLNWDFPFPDTDCEGYTSYFARQ